MSDSRKDIAIILGKLVLVCLVASALLGITYVPTQEQLKLNSIEAQKLALAEILPQASEFEPVYGSVANEDGDLPILYYRAFDSSGNLVGYAFFQEYPGAQGPIQIVGGVDTSFSTITGVQIMKHGETPGLGAKITEPDFRNQFIGIPLADMKLSKDGGKIDSITGATISSQAVIDALNAGVDLVKEHEA
ncbi:Rnf electron transport complex subunit RnfG [Methanohalophilus sp.]|uniref:Rnf electron transport complex subunit RnfG n=1 Tax=Methanohalophilus sp. TaxID=1966352 RepID=UPI00262EAABE|nr:Rnf electron transport complex subunit RnfG [Methanohalophilus sp.]MDK2892566.1 H+/Na+-translocating ferredoxin:NAD+ oxidoreductase subunit [Methanohalophilus sp.]